MAKIAEAVKSTVPQGDVWRGRREAGGAGAAPEALHVVEDGCDADYPYDPIEFIDEDDEF